MKKPDGLGIWCSKLAGDLAAEADVAQSSSILLMNVSNAAQAPEQRQRNAIR